MNFYPYTSPIIMTDNIFVSYGGLTGTSVAAQRQVAFTLAEERVSLDLDTFLLPTTITGTYLYAPYIILDNAYVNQIFVVQFLDSKNTVYWAASGSYNDYYRLRDDGYGILDLNYITSICRCGNGFPYSTRVSYSAGLPTGTANSPNILLALTTASQIFLNEILGYGNEGVADIGIQRFSNQQYSESRKALMETVYGNSAKSQFIHRLLTAFRKYRRVGI